MDDQNAPKPTLVADEIRHRPAGPAQRRPDAGARPRPLYRRRQPAGPGLCGDGAQPRCPRHHPRHRHRRAPTACRACSASIPAPISTGYGALKCVVPLKNRDGSPIKYTPRPALATDKVRFVGDPVACVIAETLAQAKDAAEAVALDIEPLPAVITARDGAQARRAAALRRRARQCRARLSLWRQPKGRRRLRQGRACRRSCDFVNSRMVVAAMEPRAAIGELRRAKRALDAAFVQPGRVRHEDVAARYCSAPRRQSARPHRQCRRLVRHEGRGLSGICLHPARRARARPAGEMDRRPLRQLRLRSSRPRPRHDRRARARQGRHISSALRLTGYGNMGAYLAPVSGR